jgi:hypothetical protein
MGAMIQINLLDQTQARNRTRRTGPTPGGGGGQGSIFGSLVVFWVALFMVGANGYVGWTLYQKVSSSGDEARRLRAEIADVEKQIATHQEKSEVIRNFQSVLTNQKEVLRTLDPADRILWCEKVNMLSGLIPQDVFVSDVDIVEVVELIETEQSRKAREKWEAQPKNKRADAPEIVKKPVIHYKVTMTGLATGRDSVVQFDNVLAFHKAMMAHQQTMADGTVRRFMDGFVQNVEFGMIESTTYEGVPVNKFVFNLRTVNQGEENLKNAKPEVAGAADESKTVALAK